MVLNNAPALGSLLMVGLPGLILDDSTLALIEQSRIHNFILFSRNVENLPQLKALCASLALVCDQQGLPAPLISIDQEGGSVARLPPPFTQFEGARKLASAPDCRERLRDYARTCARELLEVGINMNLAPVLDVCVMDQGFFMEPRCLGDDPAVVADLGSLVIREMQEAGVAACAKHFPGLGPAVLDPHLELPVVKTTRQSMEAMDFPPFREAARIGVASFMTSHAIYQELDPGVPGTMSAGILSDLLRQEMGFEGVLITDDLEMGAIEKSGSIEQACLRSFLAGADLLLICHDHQKIRRSLQALTKALELGEIQSEAVVRSLARQAELRQRFCQPRSK